MMRAWRPQLPRVLAAVWCVVAIGAVEAGWRAPASPGVGVPLPAVLRTSVETVRAAPLRHVADARRAAIVSGVVFGRTEQLDRRDHEQFLQSGLWHLLAASGQNIALVAACCMSLAAWAGGRRSWSTAGAAIAIAAYLDVVGGGASIVRAAFMGELALASWLVGVRADRWQVMLASCALICTLWPGAHRGLGFQLSYTCVVALSCWATRWSVALKRCGVPSWLALSLSATGACSIATAPLLVLRTGSAPVTGIAANVLAVPVAGVLLVVGVAGSLAAVAADAAGHTSWGAAAFDPAQICAWLLQRIASRAASWPFGQTSSLSGALLLLGSAVALDAAARNGAHLRAAWQRAPRHIVAAAAVLGAGAWASVAWSARPALAPPPADGVRIASLDIGQGDATLIQSNGVAVLVDTGPPDGRVVDRLRALGVHHVDGVVLTHDSLDHRGGFDDVRTKLHPRWTLMPVRAPGPWQRIRDTAPQLREVCAGDSLQVGAARIDVLHPRCDGVIIQRTSDVHNDGAIVLLVTCGAMRAVLPADAEAPVLAQLHLPPLTLLRVSHHGSADPALAALLAQVRPQLALISVGAHNDYGHPRRDTLKALHDAHVRVLRTDQDGTVVVDANARELRVRTHVD